MAQGSVGTIGVGSVGRGINVGGRASVGSRSSTKGFGVSLSLEARHGVASTSSLTSRDRGMLVNKGALWGKNVGRSVFDISRPVVGERGTKVSGVSRISRGIEFKAAARTPGIFDTSRPKQHITRERSKATVISPKNERSRVTPVNLSHIKTFNYENIRPAVSPRSEARNKTVTQRTLEVNLNPKKSEQRVKSIDRIHNSIVLWQRSGGERAPGVSRVSEVSKGLKSREVTRYNKMDQAANTRKSQPEHYRTQRVEGVKKNRSVTERKARKLSHQIRISKDLTPAKMAEIRANLKYAKMRVFDDMLVRNISFKEAQQAMAQRFAAMYPGKVEVLPEKVIKPKAETSTEKTAMQKIVEAAAVVSTYNSQKEEAQNREVPKKPKMSVGMPDGIRFYFKHYTEATRQRVTDVMEAARNLLSYKPEISGAELSYQLSQNTSHENQSEVSKSIKIDGTWKGFLAKIASIGKITDIGALKHAAESAAEEEKAVKLSFSKDGESVTEETAKKVYEGSIEGQRGYFREYRDSYGRFNRRGREIWFVRDTASTPAY